MAKSESSNIFCYAPWSNLEILPSGAILPCCKFQDRYYDKKFNITEDKLEEYFSSNLLKEVKRNFLDGRWPQGCDRCKIEENSDISSKRQLDYERWKDHYQTYNINTAGLLTLSMALGNTCNLKCIMCSPTASSFWAKEYADLYDIKITPLNHIRKNVIKDITNMAPDLVHIDIHGGEPFLSGFENHESLLSYYIDNGRAADISIHYTTNGTMWPDQKWLEKWEHFREIDLQISIDGIGDRYEYIRYPASWNTVRKNINQYLAYAVDKKNFRLSVAHTVSAYNIFYLDEFFDWCEETALPEPWTGALHNPAHLRPTVWPSAAKNDMTNFLHKSKRPGVTKWAHHLQTIDNSEYFSEFIKYVVRHDQYRGLDFAKTFPEIAAFL